MLRDLRELLDEDDDYPSEEERQRRNRLILGGVIGGGVVVVIVCIAIFSLIVGPRRSAARGTQIAESETQIAAINLTPTKDPRPASPTPIPPTSTATETPAPTDAASPTEQPTNTEVPASPTAPPTSTPAPTTTPQVIFFEDFEGSGGVWPSDSRENFEYGTTSGEYRILVKSAFIDAWTVRERGFDNVRVESDVTLVAGPESGFAGVICRFQNGLNYYAGVVDGSGTYHLYNKRGGEFIDLGSPGSSSQVSSLGGVNRLRLDCAGQTLTLFVNGVRVIEVQDETYDSGQVGLVAGTDAEPGLEARFDNFLIANP